MRQVEIDEISEAFKEAWTDYFGDIMEYVMFDARTSYDSLYNESKQKKYDFTNSKAFHGSLKESPSLDELHQAGIRVKKDYEITFVTKELIDKNIQYINTNDIIKYTDRFGNTMFFEIVDEFQKVQLVNNKVFTKLKVVPTSYIEYNLTDIEEEDAGVLIEVLDSTIMIENLEYVLSAITEPEESSVLSDYEDTSLIYGILEEDSDITADLSTYDLDNTKEDSYDAFTVGEMESETTLVAQEVSSSTSGTRTVSETLLNDSNKLLSNTLILTDAQLPLSFSY